MLWNLSPAGAVLSCLGIASTFVGVLYLVPPKVRKLDRDDPRHITARVRISGLACLLFPTLLYLSSDKSKLPEYTLATWLGFRTQGLLLASVAPLGLFVALFAGPLMTFYLDYMRQRRYMQRGSEEKRGIVAIVDEFLGEFCPNYPTNAHEKARNLLFAPFAEEFAFRSCMVPLLLCGGFRQRSIVCGGPLFFGIAHLHHAVGMVRQGVPLARAALVVLFQLLYTSFFGGLEMFLYLRTGHFASIALVHSWCNLMGLPSLQFLSAADPNYSHKGKISFAYLLGIVAFCVGLYPLTRPELYGSRLWHFDIHGVST